MVKNKQVQFNFTSGEISPLLEGRADLARYYNGVKTLENYIALPHGGARRREGTRFIANVKDHTKLVRLIPFEFSTEQAYILEFGHNYIRVYRNGAQIQSAGVPVEIKQPDGTVPPYLETDLDEIKWAQSADALYLVQPDYPPYRITRRSHTDWVIRKIQFEPPPTHEAKTDISGGTATLTPGATTGNGVTFTASSAVFLAGDNGKEIIFKDSLAVIKSFVSTTQVTADIIHTFPDVNPIPGGQWFLFDVGLVTLDPDKKEPVGDTITMTTALVDTFRSTDVGKYIKIYKGVVKITSVTNPQTVVGIIKSVLQSTAADPPATAKGAWSLEVDSFSASTGYPRAITFFEDRLFLGGVKSFPNRFWGSKTGDYENFALGFVDDDAVQYDIASGRINVIEWLMASNDLILGTIGGEYVATGGPNESITPSNITVKENSSYGSSLASPARIGNSTIFLQRAGKKIREFTFFFETDSFDARDLTILAEHMSGDGFVEVAYQQEPFSILWCIRKDGVLVGLTFDKKENVIAWHRHITDGKFESVAVIPHPDGDKDQVWFVVNRTIGGATKRYIEYFSPRAAVGTLLTGEDKYFYYQLNEDSALTYEGVATNTLTGLSHLEGKTVKVVGGGAVYPDKVVSGGQITGLDPKVTKAEVGLAYTSTLETLKPTMFAEYKGWADQVVVRLNNTLGLKLNGQELPYRKNLDAMDGPPPIFTGDKFISKRGWDREGRIKIIQEQALPCEILAIAGEVVVGD